MKIVVEKLLGDAMVNIYNKSGELIHVESFEGKTNSEYIRKIPVSDLELGYSKAVFSGEFKYRIQ